MADIRDSIARAIDRTIQHVATSPQPKTATPGGLSVQDVLNNARQELDSVKDEHILAGDFIHTDEMALSLVMSALEAATPPTSEKGMIIGDHKYDATDPNWVASLINELLHHKVPWIGTNGDNMAFRVQLPERDLAIAILGDWGTGLWTSSQIADFAAQHNPDLSIHLGDVYYSGTEDEVRDRFLKRFPRGKIGTFALNSNHEMYAGGDGLFNVTLKDPDFAANQKASFFSLFNSKWQIIGLDSAYNAEGGLKTYQNGNLTDDQVPWLTAQLKDAKQNGRRAIVLSHHNPIGINGTLDEGFLDQVTKAATGIGFDYWYFGHEHDAAIYDKQTRNEVTFLPRCIGHGGIPYTPEDTGAKGNGIDVLWTEKDTYAEGSGDTRAALNGFGVITLPINGADALEVLYDDSGRTRWPSAVQPKAMQAAKPAAPDKLLITNIAALKAKYGQQYVVVEQAITDLIAADQARGIATRLVAVDDAAAMQAVGGAAVANTTNPKQNKDAVDAIAKAIQPDYIVLIGGPDVVPHQDLQNPITDDDPVAWSDLPYACDAPYSTKIDDFIGPTRVVGRIPDLPGSTDPSLLAGGLKTAATWRSHTPGDYATWFGVSAQVWQQSTAQSLTNVFGGAAGMLLSPPNMHPDWTQQQLSPRAHFFNCHGADTDPQFYGQFANSYPVSQRSSVIGSVQLDGTLVAAECCYGAQLYSPPQGTDPAICSRYVERGAYAYFGSTTTAYGPASANGQADILCQLFLKHAISGASTGRSTLEARLDYVAGMPVMGPQDLKTLAQFLLLGDPSIHPVATSEAVAQSKAFHPGEAPPEEGMSLPSKRDRGERRLKLEARGEFVSRYASVARRTDPDERVHQRMLDLLKEKEYEIEDEPRLASYSVEQRGTKAAAPVEPRLHLLVARRRRDEGLPRLPNIVAFVAKETDGSFEYTELHSK